MTSPSLDDIVARINDASLPPVHLWNPDYQGTIDIVIKRDGSWWHEGGVISRASLVKLFSSILRRDFATGDSGDWVPGDGEYALVTPAERLRIDVEDAPFQILSMDVYEDKEPTLVLVTNTEEQVIVDEQHPVRVVYSSENSDPRPYVLVRDKMPALLSRSVWNELVDLAVEIDGDYGVYSAGTFFALGKAS